MEKEWTALSFFFYGFRHISQYCSLLEKKLSTSQELIHGAGEEAILPMSSGIEATHYPPFI